MCNVWKRRCIEQEINDSQRVPTTSTALSKLSFVILSLDSHLVGSQEELLHWMINHATGRAIKFEENRPKPFKT